MESDILSIFLSALLAALITHLLIIARNNSEADLRRQSLFRLIENELQRFGIPPQAYDVDKVFYRDPIHIFALSQLLSPGTLSYAKYGVLIKSLIDLEVALTIYNEYILVSNNAQSNSTIPDKSHKQMYDIMIERFNRLVDAKKQVLEQLPKKLL